jgi:hypothetical protein
VGVDVGICPGADPPVSRVGNGEVVLSPVAIVVLEPVTVECETLLDVKILEVDGLPL